MSPRTVKKSAPKKVAKKTTKKTAKKAATKKAPKKTTKKVAKKTTKHGAKKATKKVAAKKTLKPRKKATLEENFKKGERAKFGFPTSVSLAIITAPRVPLDLTAISIGMAKYGGVTFIIAGAVLTALQLPAVLPNVALPAAAFSSLFVDLAPTASQLSNQALLAEIKQLSNSLTVILLGLFLLVTAVVLTQRKRFIKTVNEPKGETF